MGVSSRDGRLRPAKFYRCTSCGALYGKKREALGFVCCEEQHLKPYRALPEARWLRVEKLLREIPGFDLTPTVDEIYALQAAISHAAFVAQERAEKLSQRDPDATGDYVDRVEFDMTKFNRNAQLVADMALIRSLMVGAGLDTFVPTALDKILARRLGVPASEAKSGKSKDS